MNSEIKQALLDSVPELIAERVNQANEYMLKKLGANIKRIGKLSPNDVRRVEELTRAGVDVIAIEREVAQRMDMTVKEVQALFEAAAVENIQSAHAAYIARGITPPAFKTNDYMRRFVESYTARTAGTLKNLSQTTALRMWSERQQKVTSLSAGYIDAIDQAVTNTALGVETYQQAMRDTLRRVGDKGLQTVDFASGVSRRLDTVVRANVLEGVRQINQGIQDRIGEEIGADGVEISVHEFCAPDHKDIQGKQLTKAEYSIWQAAHAYPKRQIGHLNCHHFAFAIVLGISPPNYSQSELAEINARNDKGITYEGQHYTMYECTQIQRQLETAIRRYSDIKVMAESAGDEKLVSEMQGKIDKITRKYEDFSAKANLRVKSERLNMYGYRKKKK